MKRTVIIITAIVGLVVLGAVGWYLARPLFYDRAVDEGFPADGPAPAELAAVSGEKSDISPAQVVDSAAQMPDEQMDEALQLQQGQFKDADSFHKGAGSATIYQLSGGERVLRFEDFSVTNGPDLHVLLAAHPNPASRDDVHEAYIDLGPLKGNVGNQNYDIPADVDLSQYQSVVIYCEPFHVVFATATLN